MTTGLTRDDVWRELIAASKKRKGSIYTRYVNRVAAIPITYVLWRLGVQPNAVSLFSSTITHFGLMLLLVVDVSLTAVTAAYAFLVVGYVLDSCDGQLARVSGTSSTFGEWLDHTLDIVKLLNFNLVLGYLLLVDIVNGTLPWVPVLISIALNITVQPAHFFAITLKSVIIGKEGHGKPNGPSGSRSVQALRFMRNIADYGFFMPIVFLLLNKDVFLYTYLAYGAYYCMLFTAHIARTYLQSREHSA